MSCIPCQQTINCIQEHLNSTNCCHWYLHLHLQVRVRAPSAKQTKTKSTKSSSSSSSSSSSTPAPAPTAPTCANCPTGDNFDCCCDDYLPCPTKSVTNCLPLVPKCDILVFNEDFSNFATKVTNTIWNQSATGDSANPLANDGVLSQECDGIVLDSNVYGTLPAAFSYTHPFTTKHFAYNRTLAAPSSTTSGVSFEFTVSQNTKNVERVRNPSLNIPFDVFYECSGLDPNDDLRLANSAFSVNDSNTDKPFVKVVFTRNKVYCVYGLLRIPPAPADGVPQSQRDEFIAAIPIADREGKWSEKMTFTLSLNNDGSFQIFQRDVDTCEYNCVLYVDNWAVPPKDRKYTILIRTRANLFSATPVTPIFVSSPLQVLYPLTIEIGNYKEMEAMEPLATTIPTTVLYNVTTDTTVAANAPNVVFRWVCDCGSNALLPADSILTLPTATPTTALDYGQGSAIKFYNLIACFYN